LFMFGFGVNLKYPDYPFTIRERRGQVLRQ